MWKKVLIANRGEIAVRIIRACREAGLQCVTVYSTADKTALHAEIADESVCIGPPSVQDSYLNMNALISACQNTGAEALHPGFGFLSESAEFAQLCIDNGITFIGPSPASISMLGDKARAKETMKAAGVPVIPGSDGAVPSVEEAKKITAMPAFKGYIHDVGGPSANFSRPACDKQAEHGACAKRQCLWPKPCTNLKVDHSHYVEMLDAVRALPGVKKVFIRSGIRYDYLMYDQDETFFDRLVQYHISGQLKVAPEHISAAVLDKMGKPRKELYLKFVEKYHEKNREFGKKQYLVPYLMSSHPGCTLNDAIELACYLKKIRHTPQQVQDFYPTPGTLATCMYYTGRDPRTMKPVYVAKTYEEKLEQRALMQYSYPKNHDIVLRALRKAHREDLIGNGPKCLIPWKKPHDVKRRR